MSKKLKKIEKLKKTRKKWKLSIRDPKNDNRTVVGSDWGRFGVPKRDFIDFDVEKTRFSIGLKIDMGKH